MSRKFLLGSLAGISAVAAAAAFLLWKPAPVAAAATPVRIEAVTEALEYPWALAFMPDGRMLVTEKPGRLRIVARDGTVSPPIGGVPKVLYDGQGGLQDVALAPDFETSRLVYLSYAEADEEGASGTAVARGRLDPSGVRLDDVEVIFRQVPKLDENKHFGSRVVFAPDGKLFVLLGDRFQFDPAQDLASGLGKVMRVNPDGSVPPDNPFVGKEGAQPAIWSYGHRNIEAGAIDPASGRLWIAEFGPRGGDELNQPQPGRNYGWPLVSWGTHYSFVDIDDPTTRPDFADAVHHWTPVISPSGMAFYQGDLFPGWKGSMLIGGLSSLSLVRVTLSGDGYAGEERIVVKARVRDVAEGPDGAVYLVTDEEEGRVLRLVPAENRSGQ